MHEKKNQHDRFELKIKSFSGTTTASANRPKTIETALGWRETAFVWRTFSKELSHPEKWKFPARPQGASNRVGVKRPNETIKKESHHRKQATGHSKLSNSTTEPVEMNKAVTIQVMYYYYFVVHREHRHSVFSLRNALFRWLRPFNTRSRAFTPEVWYYDHIPHSSFVVLNEVQESARTYTFNRVEVDCVWYAQGIPRLVQRIFRARLFNARRGCLLPSRRPKALKPATHSVAHGMGD